MSDSPRPSFLGAGLPKQQGRLGSSAVLDDDDDLPDEVTGGDRWGAGLRSTASSLRSTPVLLVGLGVVLVALLVAVWWALSRDVGPAIAPGPSPLTVIEPDRAAGAAPADPATVPNEGAVTPEVPGGPVLEDAAVEDAVAEDAAAEPASIDAPRPDSSITGHTVSAELCDALAALRVSSSAAMSAGGQGSRVSPQLLAAYVALGEVPSPYQSTYRDYAVLLSDDSIPTSAEAGALSEAFTEAVRIDQVTCL